jgi:hypothetical protein
MTGASIANTHTILDVLHELDGDFARVAIAVENGEFALWVGSGISGKAPSLGGLIGRAIEFFRAGAVDPATEGQFMPALKEALRIAEADPAASAPFFCKPFSDWPEAEREAIVKRLWNRYSALLDIRIEGKDEDFVLWEAVDIRAAFDQPAPPTTEHLCIAILILEGAVKEIASANWDGFIEAAVERLGPGMAGNLQVVVDPDHLRDGVAKAQLLKFHGCIVHAKENEIAYRKFLTGSETQITNWTETGVFAPMVNKIVGVATNNKALMVGLSLQDANLQSIFARARRANPWPWPCAPAAQGHVFCEQNGLGDKQKAMLKTVYKNSYNNYIADIHKSSLLQYWPEKVLLAVVFRLVANKLAALMAKRLSVTPFHGEAMQFAGLLFAMRNAIAGAVTGDHTDFANRAIAAWSRLVQLFRDGALSPSDAYEAISPSTAAHVANDMNARAVGYGDLAILLTLLEHGRSVNNWRLTAPNHAEITGGSVLATGQYPGAVSRTIFLVRSAREALELRKAGAFANDDVIVIHGDDMWQLLPSESDTGENSARMRSKAPGRTGRPKTHHVSLKRMIDSETNLAGLQRRFTVEVTL